LACLYYVRTTTVVKVYLLGVYPCGINTTDYIVSRGTVGCLIYHVYHVLL